MLGGVKKLFIFKSFLTMPSNVMPLHLKQIFPPMIWIFTKDEGDGIESSLPFKIFSTLFWNICIFFLNFFNDILPGYFFFSLDLNSTAVIYLLDGEIWMHRYSKWHLVRQWQCPHLQHLHTVRIWKMVFQKIEYLLFIL